MPARRHGAAPNQHLARARTNSSAHTMPENRRSHRHLQTPDTWVASTVAVYLVPDTLDVRAQDDAIDAGWFPAEDLDRLDQAVRDRAAATSTPRTDHSCKWPSPGCTRAPPARRSTSPTTQDRSARPVGLRARKPDPRGRTSTTTGTTSSRPAMPVTTTTASTHAAADGCDASLSSRTSPSPLMRTSVGW